LGTRASRLTLPRGVGGGNWVQPGLNTGTSFRRGLDPPSTVQEPLNLPTHMARLARSWRSQRHCLSYDLGLNVPVQATLGRDLDMTSEELLEFQGQVVRPKGRPHGFGSVKVHEEIDIAARRRRVSSQGPEDSDFPGTEPMGDSFDLRPVRSENLLDPEAATSDGDPEPWLVPVERLAAGTASDNSSTWSPCVSAPVAVELGYVDDLHARLSAPPD